MRVIVDTSVWSLALRRPNPKVTPETKSLSDLILEGRVVLLGAIRQEILSGVRYPEQFERLRLALEPFPDEPIGTSDYVDAAELCNDCLASGVLTGNADCFIAAVAISRGMEVLTTDKDFVHMSGVVPVELYR
ncbi:MAG: PIN domain-containing protein [Verrucomicrobiota bacterium]